MRALRKATKAVVLLLAPLLPALGCNGMKKMFTPTQPSPATMSTIDEPPPLHTGGLEVLSGSPPTPGHHGNPAAEAVATGLGAGILGVGAAKTMVNCAQPDAGPNCLAGPGPGGTENDAGR